MSAQTIDDAIPPARLTIPEACRALRFTKPMLYKRINAGEIKSQREGVRRYISVAEVQRYVASLDSQDAA
jgi:excisionase family DNA binding protein